MWQPWLPAAHYNQRWVSLQSEGSSQLVLAIDYFSFVLCGPIDIFENWFLSATKLLAYNSKLISTISEKGDETY